MALVKTVELRVLADAGDAQAKLDELDAKAKDLDGNAIKMRFRVDDGDGKAQLDDLRAKADLLGFKDVSIKVRVDGAGRAIAELMAVKHEEDKIRDTSLEGKGGGFLSGLRGKLGSLTGLDGLGGGGGGGLGGAGGGALSGLPLLGSLGPAGLAALIPVGAALLQEVVGLASGFAAAGAGAGAFALLAYPAIKKVEAALTDTPAKLAKLKLSPDESGAVAGIRALEAEYKKLSLALEPQAFKVFNAGLKVANSLLPAALPFARTFADVLTRLFGQLGKFTQSKGFGDWLKQFHSLEGPALGAIGHGIGEVANQIGKLLTTMSGKDVAHAINIAFDGLAGAIGGVVATVKFLMTTWDGASIAARTGAHAIASAFDSIRHAGAGIGREIVHDFDALATIGPRIIGFFAGAGSWLIGAGRWVISGFMKGAQETWAAVSGWFSGLGGRVSGFLAGAGGWLVHAGEAVMDGFLSGLKAGWSQVTGFVSSIGAWISAHKGPLEADRLLLVPHGQAIMGGLMRGMDSQVPALTAQLAGITGTIGRATAGHGGYGGGGGDHIELHIHSLQTSDDIARVMVQTLKKYKRNGGGAALGIA